MKITIGEYELNIKVTRAYNDRANKADTLAFLNEMCIWLIEANRSYQKNGLEALEKRTDKQYNELFKQLEEKGYYKNIK